MEHDFIPSPASYSTTTEAFRVLFADMALSKPEKEYSIEMAKAMAEEGTPIRDAAATWGVSKSTIHRRLTGDLPLREAKEAA